jgi:hypothetical protein
MHKSCEIPNQRGNKNYVWKCAASEVHDALRSEFKLTHIYHAKSFYNLSLLLRTEKITYRDGLVDYEKSNDFLHKYLCLQRNDVSA